MSVTEQQFYDGMLILRKDIKKDIDDAMSVYIANQNSICMLHKKTADTLLLAINGNGKAGLKEEVTKIKSTLKIYNWVVGVAATVIVGVITKSIITYFIKV